MSEKAILTYQFHLDGFKFLGKTNLVDERSDFGQIWDGFFKMGGYRPIRPYATERSPIQVCTMTRRAGRSTSMGSLWRA